MAVSMLHSPTETSRHHGRGRLSLSEGRAPGRVRRHSGSMAAALDVAAGEDAGDVVQDVGGRVLVVAVVADQPGLDDVDLLLGVLVHDAGDQAGELDGVLL